MSSDVDVVIAGHTHNEITPVWAVLVVEARSFGTAYDRVDLAISRASGEVVAKRAHVVPTVRGDAPRTRRWRRSPALRAPRRAAGRSRGRARRQAAQPLRTGGARRQRATPRLARTWRWSIPATSARALPRARSAMKSCSKCIPTSTGCCACAWRVTRWGVARRAHERTSRRRPAPGRAPSPRTSCSPRAPPTGAVARRAQRRSRGNGPRGARAIHRGGRRPVG